MSNDRRSKGWERVIAARNRPEHEWSEPERELRAAYEKIKNEGASTSGLELIMEVGVGPQSPIEAIVWFVDVGAYPPPELLLALRDQWRRYVGARGDLGLEEALISPPVQKAGNFAQRSQIRKRSLGCALLIACVGAQKPELSQTGVAEYCATEYDLDIDAEVMLRSARQYDHLKIATRWIRQLESGKSVLSRDLSNVYRVVIESSAKMLRALL